MLIIFAIAVCFCSSAVSSFGYGSPYDFSLTGTTKKDTLSVPKNDSEQNAYVTTSKTYYRSVASVILSRRRILRWLLGENK